MRKGENMPIKLDLATIDFVSATLKKEKVFTLQKLTSLLNCSRRTAQTRLSRWKTFTSYNHNSKYYAFPEIPKFNIHGLWCYKNIAFSVNGTLKKTIIHLVNSSEAGLTGNELGALLGIPPQNFVHHFKDCPGIYREKHGGVYIHFAGQEDRHGQQVKRRLVVGDPVGKDTITEGDAIVILVAILNHLSISPTEIIVLPEVNERGISELAIQNFLQAHGIVKKILDSNP
jgi:hypothetical protein